MEVKCAADEERCIRSGRGWLGGCPTERRLSWGRDKESVRCQAGVSHYQDWAGLGDASGGQMGRKVGRGRGGRLGG